MMKHLLMLVKVCVQKAGFLKHQFSLLSINLNFGSSFAAPTNPEDQERDLKLVWWLVLPWTDGHS
jgi:hypothetical protein